jgi:hypothetical protein
MQSPFKHRRSGNIIINAVGTLKGLLLDFITRPLSFRWQCCGTRGNNLSMIYKKTLLKIRPSGEFKEEVYVSRSSSLVKNKHQMLLYPLILKNGVKPHA